MTVREAFETGTQTLRASGEDADEARVKSRLWLDFLTQTRRAHLMCPQQELSAELETRWRAGIQELRQGRPLPYVTGRIEFFGLPFRCDERALIPRPETELLVEAALTRLKIIASPQLADLGTGTGCIAISSAHARTDATVWATDLSADALKLARENAQSLGVQEQIRFVPGRSDNWAGTLPREVFDAMLSNPPYIARAEVETLERSVRDYEPRLALEGGADGLRCYRQIAVQCGVLLKPRGFLMVELGAEQWESVCAIFAKQWQVEPPLFDFQGIARVLIATPHEACG